MNGPTQAGKVACERVRMIHVWCVRERTVEKRTRSECQPGGQRKSDSEGTKNIFCLFEDENKENPPIFFFTVTPDLMRL